MKFAKYHALGNDYLVIEANVLEFAEAQAKAALICHRNYGIGSDGILLGPLPSTTAAAALRIINPDGSEAEKSGNGLRIFARYLWDTGRVSNVPFAIETRGGVAPATVLSEHGLVRVGMGRASFDSEVVGIIGPRREVLAETLHVAGEELRWSGVSVGNPHCVIIGSPVSEERARHLGPLIERDARFANRTNVQLCRVIDRANIEIQIWERGAGYTLASGSSASAAASAAKRLGFCDGQVTVHMPGGRLEVQISDTFEVQQTGPVTRVATGELSPEMFEQGRSWSRAPSTTLA